MHPSMLPAALLALVPVASAGYTYGTGGSSSSGSTNSGAVSSGSAAAEDGVFVVNVGRNGQTMEPNEVVVPVGGIIEFHFFQGAHSVAQSAFDTPCTPLNANNTVGFFSGSQQVASGEGANVFRVVSTGNPMWYYCATGRHCQNGMVGVINKPAARTLAAYAAAAARASQNVTPSTIGGGTLAQAGTASGGSGTGTGTGTGTGNTGGTNTGTGTTPTRTPSAGVGSFSGLSLPVLGLAALAAAALTL